MPLIIGTRLSIRMGLVRNKSIPDPVASRCVSACATPVKAAIVTRGLVSSVFSYSRIRLVDSRPSMTGMEISVKIIRLTMPALMFKRPTHKNHSNGRGIRLENLEGFFSVLRNNIIAIQLLHEGNKNSEIDLIIIHKKNGCWSG